MSNGMFIRNMSDPTLTLDRHDDVWTADPKDAQQYASIDVAASKVKAIQHLFPDLSLEEIHYDTDQGSWVQRTYAKAER